MAEIDDILATEGDDAVDRARALWFSCRVFSEPPVPGVERLAVHPTQHVRFFAACIARFNALKSGAALPPYLAPDRPLPALGDVFYDRASRGSRSYRVSWTGQTDPERSEQRKQPRAGFSCRLCAAPSVTTVYFVDDSGTGWTSRTHEVRCDVCGAFSRLDFDD